MATNPTRSDAPECDDSALQANAPVELVAAALRGEAVDAGRLAERRHGEEFLQIVSAHGAGPLLHHWLETGGAAGKWPHPIRKALDETARAEAARETMRVEEIRRVLASLDAARIVPLVVEGTALAYTVYHRPHLRPREDTGLLVKQAAVANAVQILAELGYRRCLRPPGERVLGQDAYVREDGSGFTHALSLHWAIGDGVATMDALAYTTLRQRAVAIEALSPCAQGLCHEDALLHACLRPPRRDDERGLIPLYDLHLLLERMTAVELARFARAAIEKRLGIPARDAIAHAQARFQTALPFGTLNDHLPEAKLAEEARLRRGATSGRHRLHSLIYDLRVFARARDKLSRTLGHAFPPRAYMRERYAASPSAWLPALYLRRGLEGLAALLKRSP